MNKDSAIDYLACILVKVLGPLLRSLPASLLAVFGRGLGELLYHTDLKHRAVAYANLRIAFSKELKPRQILAITRRFYRNLGQNIIEMFLFLTLKKEYIDKYIAVCGLEHLKSAAIDGKGVIIVGMHEGNWELSSVAFTHLGFSFALFVRPQRYPRLTGLLNSYRSKKGYRLIVKGSGSRDLVDVIRKKQALIMSVDQGGRQGVLVKFFGKTASMSAGAVKLAEKYDVRIIAGFIKRYSGPYMRFILEPFTFSKSNPDPAQRIRENVQKITSLFEGFLKDYPDAYLWTYKVWKYSDEKTILVLSDAKAGHLNQAQALAQTLCSYYRQKGLKVESRCIEVKFKSPFARAAFIAGSCLSGKYSCQGCLWCLEAFLLPQSYRQLVGEKPDAIISCGAALAPLNSILSRENLARSIVMMRPPLKSLQRFDAVIMPRHDNPPSRPNVITTAGALNLIDAQFLESRARKMSEEQSLPRGPGRDYIGLLLGGDSKKFRLTAPVVKEVIFGIKSVAENLGADILATTSRRTPAQIEAVVREDLAKAARCKLLVVANEKNIPDTVAGISGLSTLIVTSPESVSMISEAATSGKYVVVFDAGGLSRKHRCFLEHFARQGYIRLVSPADIGQAIESIWRDRPPVRQLRDREVVMEAFARLGF